jgi:hypothetical protein
MSSSLSPNAKIVLLTSEAGSLTLRTEGEGGGMFGHHGSKAAGNMIGHLLGYELKERGVPIAMIHVSKGLPTSPSGCSDTSGDERQKEDISTDRY